MILNILETIDWGAIVLIVGGLLSAVGVPLAAINQWKKQHSEEKRDDKQDSTDYLFRLIEKLEAEIERKDLRIDHLEKRVERCERELRLHPPSPAGTMTE